MDSRGQEKNASPCGNLPGVILITALYRLSPGMTPKWQRTAERDRRSNTGTTHEMSTIVDFRGIYPSAGSSDKDPAFAPLYSVLDVET